MSVAATSQASAGVIRERRFLRLRDFYYNWPMYLLLVPGILFALVFNYLPMVGAIIAFENFDPIAGLFGSQFVGLQNFQTFFQGSDWVTVIWNTVFLNFIFIVSGTTAAVFIAIILTELGRNLMVRFVQSVVVLPNFISWPIVAMMSLAFLQTNTGIVDKLMTQMHMTPINFYAQPGVWPVTLMLFNMWKTAGFGAIIYMAAITGFDKALYEAAKIDGASRMQCIFRITLPMLRPTIAIMLLLALSGMFRGNTDMMISMVGNDSLLFPTTNVIDTYVFRNVMQGTNFGLVGAIGLMQSVLNLLLLVVCNWIARRLNPDYALF